MATPEDHLSYTCSFNHESQKSSNEFPDNGKVKLKLVYKSDGLHLCLLSGASSVSAFYFVRVDYYENYSHQTLYRYGNKSVKLHQSVSLNTPYKKDERRHPNQQPKTTLQLFILRSDPYVTIPPESMLSSQLSSTFKLAPLNSLNDVTLYFGQEEKPFQVNKFILMARSPVFRTMLKSNFEEAKSCKVKIPDISPEVGQEMITFLYTDKAPNVSTATNDLWFAADKYDLSGLKALCENELAKQLNLENAARILLFASRYCGNGELKDHVVEFITLTKETCSLVMKSEDWKEVKKFPDVAYAVSDKFFDVPSEPAAKKARTQTPVVSFIPPI